MSETKLPKAGSLRLRAYCIDCGALLMESNPLTKKQLLANWNESVLNAAGIKCDACGHKVPNFHIELRIYNSVLKTEVLPTEYKPLHMSKKEGMRSAQTLYNALKKAAEEAKTTIEPDDGVTLEDLPTETIDVTENHDVVFEKTPDEIASALEEEIARRKSN